jgi:23S rRNA (adenine2503-C2)-methyltransferase
MDERIDILGLTRAGFETAAGLGAGRSRALGALYRRAFLDGGYAPEAAGLSKDAAALLDERFRVDIPEPVEVVQEEGELGLTSKVLLRLADGETIECVCIPVASRGKSGRRPGTTAGAEPPSSLCVSSQVGCRMGCAFCETGKRGLRRNLTAAEIVGQLVAARARLGWSIGNIVFMGMGEPLDNFEGVSGALAVLLDTSGAGFSQESITVCTAGLPAGIARLRDLGLKRLNLSVSLNAGDDETRARLMPVTRGANLAALAAALRGYPQRPNFALGVNYCLIPGVNDGPGAAEGVAAFLAAAAPPGRALLNLIPYNPGSTAPLGPAPTEAEIEDFRGRLAALGVQVKLRVPRGRGLMAACGQLGGACHASRAEAGGFGDPAGSQAAQLCP